MREKALCVFLNSTIGILSTLGNRTNKRSPAIPICRLTTFGVWSFLISIP